MILKYIFIIFLKENSISSQYWRRPHDNKQQLIVQNEKVLDKYNKIKRKYYIFVICLASCYFICNMYVIIQYLNNTSIIFNTFQSIIMFSIHILSLIIVMIIAFCYFKSRYENKKSIECWKILNIFIFAVNILILMIFVVMNISFPQSNFLIILNNYLFLDTNIHFTDALGIVFMAISSIKIILNIVIYCLLNSLQKIIRNI